VCVCRERERETCDLILDFIFTLHPKYVMDKTAPDFSVFGLQTPYKTGGGGPLNFVR